MGKRKLKATRQLQCIAALAYNPYFEEKVKEIQRVYAIPVDPHQGFLWFLEHAKNKKRVYPLFLPKGRYPFLEVNMGKSITDTELGLEKDILCLLADFQLPNWMFVNVLQYVLDGNRLWLHPAKPQVQCDLDVRGIDTQLHVAITGLHHWTTQKEWKQIWDYYVKPELETAKIICEKVLDIEEPARKRHTPESYVEQMHRWSEWYQFSEIQGLGPTQALAKWEGDHPEHCGAYDLSTVAHAIDEFAQIIKPLSVAA